MSTSRMTGISTKYGSFTYTHTDHIFRNIAVTHFYGIEIIRRGPFLSLNDLGARELLETHMPWLTPR